MSGWRLVHGAPPIISYGTKISECPAYINPYIETHMRSPPIHTRRFGRFDSLYLARQFRSVPAKALGVGGLLSRGVVAGKL
jgi:hypothetical protein